MRRTFGGGYLVGAAGLLGLALLTGDVVSAQQYHGLPTVEMQAPTVPNARAGNVDNPMLVARRTRAMNERRQQELVRDTDELLKLARELNAPTTAGQKAMEPEERLKNLARMEKLAKHVRQQMSSAFSGGPTTHSPFSAWQR